MPAPKAIRVKTSGGWQDIAIMGPTGPGSSSPLGSITEYDGATDPTDPAWLIADGRAISRTGYLDYFNLVGTRHGVGNGSTTFNILNMAGKVPVGRDAAQAEFDTLGEIGGAKTHTLTALESGLRDHSHRMDFHPNTSVGGSGFNIGDVAGPANQNGYGSGSAPAVNAHNNLQPYRVLNYIVRVLPGVPNYGTGIPIGSPIPWLVAAIPGGFREFDGSPIVQATHPQLYALFGATIPDLRERVLMGASGAYGIGTQGGELAHILTTPEIPAHAHSQAAQTLLSTGAHSMAWDTGPAVAAQDYQGGATQNAGGGGAHNNLQPYRTVKWITVAG